MAERWAKQEWHIEFRKGRDESKDFDWFVKGTPWRVRLEPAWYLTHDSDLKFPDLADFDRTHPYRFIGTPVDQTYGVITFYLTSRPEKFSDTAPEKTEANKGQDAPKDR